MIRISFAALLATAFLAPAAPAQDFATRRAAKAIRAQEKAVLDRITQRMEWDKRLKGATVSVDVEPGGAVFLRGSVMNEAAKLLAVELVENTTGVTSVVDELAVVKATKIYEAKTASPVIEVTTPVVVPPGSKVILTP